MYSLTFLNIQILCLFQETYTQVNYGNMYYQSPLANNQQFYQPQENMDYDNEQKTYYRSKYHRSHRYKKYGSSGGVLPPLDEYNNSEDESDECKCLCTKCDSVQPCCKNVCTNCNLQSQSSLIFVPYPYPIVVPTPGTQYHESGVTSTTTASPTRETTRTTKEVSTTAAPTKAETTEESYQKTSVATTKDTVLRGLSDIFINEPIIKNDNARYILTSLRRTKPYWLPKYGIVPIPDKIAEKLMSQVRDTKNFHKRY